MLHQEHISGWFITRGDSLADILDHVSTPRVWPCGYSTLRGSDGGFDRGTQTWDQAMNLARYGWPEGRDRMSSAISAAAALHKPANVQTRAYDVAGAYPDVGLFCAGDPACMVTDCPEDRQSKPLYRLVINLSAACYINGQTIINRGAAILSYADALQAQGKRIEIFVQDTSIGRAKFTWGFMLKREDQALDVDQAAFVLANPAMLRRIGFAMAEREKALYELIGTGYGRSASDEPEAWKTDKSITFRDLSSSSDNAKFATIESAMAAVGETLAAIL